jgi:hypothetical protein
MAQTHVINRLQIEIDVPVEDMAFRLKEQLSHYWHDWVVTHMERALEMLSPGDEIIRIDRLEIDLGNLAFEDFDTDFLEKIQNAFANNLSHYVAANQKPVEKKDIIGNDQELLIYFLENGSLPWWSVTPQNLNFNVTIEQLHDRQPDALRAILHKVFNLPRALLRLLFQFESALINVIISELFQAENQVGIFKTSLSKIRHLNNSLSFSEKQSNRLETLLLIRHIKNESPAYSEKDPATIINKAVTLASEEKWPELMQQLIFQPVSISEASKVSQQEKQTRQEVNTTEPDGTRFFIRQAGIILLAPFLPQFFKKLNLLSEGRFIDSASAHKAVLLLGYLSCGKDEMPEYDLIFEKILCGLGPNEPIPLALTLTEAERTEAAELLDALVEHWEVLKSIEGLRQAFLQREGILEDKGNHWLLRIERKSFDILLDHRPPPWSFRLLRFSWNPKLIETVW